MNSNASQVGAKVGAKVRAKVRTRSTVAMVLGQKGGAKAILGARSFLQRVGVKVGAIAGAAQKTPVRKTRCQQRARKQHLRCMWGLLATVVAPALFLVLASNARCAQTTTCAATAIQRRATCMHQITSSNALQHPCTSTGGRRVGAKDTNVAGDPNIAGARAILMERLGAKVGATPRIAQMALLRPPAILLHRLLLPAHQSSSRSLRNRHVGRSGVR